ncbi:pyridoxamine 5'-phosphate oxidase family protein [Nannocystis bainbridge]|uniref:Pyridoxamine 5'-phosphate oxidase family protein n=1 Tax=Nannocystis bainbridge TaxID=2995303 RepID=A0ABT5DPN8_9BACT|nr:pyridoxamine 5'-phosphate oxidase family protein [Nannocystis bainbridge]MDC0715620.1 pyridoxamine 5'-phosphate oxidase family protein [Nannocystis bainbridge]
MERITSVEGLERVVGSRPLGSLMKSIDALDDNCVRLIAACTFVVVGFVDDEGRPRTTALGGPAGFVEVLDAGRLRLPLHEPIAPSSQVGCGLLLLIPGLGETLRVNGVGRRDGDALLLEVEEAFAHCAKALLRSSLWGEAAAGDDGGPLGEAQRGPLADAEVLAFLARAPLVTLSSWDAAGAADVSPKGDPAGFLRIVGDSGLAVPERPGNRRTDTFHNVIEQSRVALLALVPGDGRVLEASGSAWLTADPPLLTSMRVAGKTPKLALVLAVTAVRLAESPAIVASGLWDRSRHADRAALPEMSRVFVEHVKRNKERGLAAKLLRKLASPWVMNAALAHDYEKNLY